MQNKLLVAIAIVILGVFAATVGGVVFQEEETQPSLEEYILERYDRIKAVEITDDLQEEFAAIIRKRTQCYEGETSFHSRLSNCRKAYINSLVRLSRKSVKSSPRLGEYLRCVSDCPITAALCNGESDSDEKDCIYRETQCLEYCLDEYWRGGTPPVDRTWNN